jgi:hypothetical protein
MILPSFHLFIKQCHNPWRLSLYRTIVVINQRQLSTKRQDKNQGLVQSQNNQIEIATFTQKGTEILP